MTLMEVVDNTRDGGEPKSGIGEFEVYPQLTIPIKNQLYVARFVAAGHPLVGYVQSIERDTLVSTGEVPEEVEKEFAPYEAKSIFVMLSAKNADLDDGNQIEGMARFIPYDPTSGNKTVNDLATLIAKAVERDPDFIIDNGIQYLTDEPIVDTLWQQLEGKYLDGGQRDQVMDLATLAPRMNLGFARSMRVMDGLMKAMNVFTSDLEESNVLSDITQFTRDQVHLIIKDRFGYPLEELFGLPPMLYDTFHNELGEEANMIAVSSILNLRKLRQRQLDAVSGTSGLTGGALSHQKDIAKLVAERPRYFSKMAA